MYVCLFSASVMCCAALRCTGNAYTQSFAIVQEDARETESVLVLRRLQPSNVTVCLYCTEYSISSCLNPFIALCTTTPLLPLTFHLLLPSE